MLYRRRQTSNWWCRFSIGHREIRQSCGTPDRSSAEEFEQNLRARLWREIKLGERSYTWEQAVERWQKDCQQRPATLKRTTTILEWFAEPMANLRLTEISSGVVSAAQDALVAQRVNGKPLSPSTVNRYLAVLRAVLNHAVEKEMVRAVPKVPLLRLEDREPRWLTREEFESLAAELPEHLRAPARFAALTGLRLGNVQGLVWGRVDLARAHVWIPATTAKGRKAISVPLSPEAVDVLKGIAREDGQDRVFLYRVRDKAGKALAVRPMGNPKVAFGKAVKRAGLAPFRWHDLRHTWASWQIQDGVPAYVVQHLGGWASGAMVQKYAHLDSAHLSQWVRRTKTGTGGA